jgi:hypothetical protein
VARTLALRRHALSRYGGTNSPRYGGTTHISRTASRTSRATVARTSCRTHISRYGGTHSLTHSRAAISRESAPRVPHHEHSALRSHGGTHSRAAMSALWKHKCSCHRSADILSKARAIVANPARYFTRDNWPGNCHDGQYEPSKIFYARQLPGQLSRRSNPARYFTRDNYPGNCHDGQYRYFTRDNCPANCYDRQYETSKVLTVL